MKNKLFLCLCISTLCNITFAQTDIPHIWYGDTILYVMPENSANYVEWGGYGEDITFGNAAANHMNGQLNTSSIVEQLGENNGLPYAARFFDTLTAFGYSDWYLPAHMELFRICQKADSIGDFKDDSYIYWNSAQSLGMFPIWLEFKCLGFVRHHLIIRIFCSNAVAYVANILRKL
ncbi:MAG: hypothetical protein JXR36_06120 [Bacteroidales bacterium]|nr:hypothetical protein [Bacteroidales bacterium]